MAAEAQDYGTPALLSGELVDIFAMIKGNPGQYGAMGLVFTGNPSDGAKAFRTAARIVLANRRHVLVNDVPEE